MIVTCSISLLTFSLDTHCRKLVSWCFDVMTMCHRTLEPTKSKKPRRSLVEGRTPATRSCWSEESFLDHPPHPRVGEVVMVCRFVDLLVCGCGGFLAEIDLAVAPDCSVTMVIVEWSNLPHISVVLTNSMVLMGASINTERTLAREDK